MNRVAKLGSPCCMKHANAAQACMLKRMKEGLTPTNQVNSPSPLCSKDVEIKAYLTSVPQKATEPWTILKHLQPVGETASTGSLANEE